MVLWGLYKPRKTLALVSILSLLAFYFLLQSYKSAHKSEVSFHIKKDSPTKTNTCFRSPSGLLRDLLEEKDRFYDDVLRPDYGELVDLGVFNKSTLSELVLPGGTKDNGKGSMERLKRRMKIKILRSCLSNDMATYTFITSGNSVAAGHGNLFNESYTYSMESAAQKAFRSVGINLVAKNYGIGNMVSAPEIAMCQTALFGMDIDLLLSDFVLTDGRRWSFLYFWFAQRAGSHPSFPALLAMSFKLEGINDEISDQNGLTTFTMLNHKKVVRNFFPDSKLVPNPELLPRGVSNYRCGSVVEDGAPPCFQNKFDSMKYCENPKHRVRWHNGWKDHLFLGRMLASFMVHTLIEALQELDPVNWPSESSMKPSMTEQYLHYLESLDVADKEFFHTSQVPPKQGSNDPRKWKHEIGEKMFSVLLRNNSMCHSALLPSEARYNGLVDKRYSGEHLWGGYHDFPVEKWGKRLYVTRYKPDQLEEDSSTLSHPFLSYVNTPQSCNALLEIDFKNHFTVRDSDGWMADTYPNNAEVNILGRGHGNDDDQSRVGIIILCTTTCRQNSCVHSYVHLGSESFQDFGAGPNITILVDGRPVARTLSDNKCHILQDEDGSILWGPGTANGLKGQFEMKFHVQKPDGTLFLSSIIVV